MSNGTAPPGRLPPGQRFLLRAQWNPCLAIPLCLVSYELKEPYGTSSKYPERLKTTLPPPEPVVREVLNENAVAGSAYILIS